MGGDSQPFMYAHPSKYSFVGPSEKGFNPRAASEASWRPPLSRPKPEGPLIQSRELNRHPDSYFVVPYGNLNWKSLSPRTKDKVKWVRLTILLLRIFSLLGAGGMLFCVICIRNTDAMTGWIIRVPAGIAILHAVYAIYHLARSSRGRTPASSASYMLFAAIIDISLIPFYVFAALMARVEYMESSETPDRWSTLFHDDGITYKIIYSTFLISVVCGGLHLISFTLSLYLGVLYRKISRLPPDMNPLEDNLTSRHKRNKSSLAENRNSQMSTTTLKGATASEVDDPLISPVRTVPFMHTRDNSQLSLSDQHPSRVTPSSKVSTSVYQQPPSKRNSKLSLASGYGASIDQTLSNSTTYTKVTNPTLQDRHPTSLSYTPQHQYMKGPLPRGRQFQEHQESISRSLTKSSSIYSTDSTAATNTTLNAQSISTVPPPPGSNWITHPSPASSYSSSRPREARKAAYQPLLQIAHLDDITGDENQPHHASGNPLEMNPPTPKLEQWRQRSGMKDVQGPLTLGTGNMRRQGSWSQGPGTLGISKIRTWDGMNDLVESRNEGARVISRSGIQIRGEGILPSGGVRAREVSGKVMEEGRGTSNWHLVSE